MKRPVSYFAAFLVGVLIALLGSVLFQTARAETGATIPTRDVIGDNVPPDPGRRQLNFVTTATPGATNTPLPTPTTAPTSTPTASVSAGVEGKEIGWTGEIQCLNCSPFPVRVQLNHYNPTAYDPLFPQLNCWDYSEPYKYCLSPVWIGVPWESGWGLFAACSNTWAVGSWLEVPGAITVICMDQGGDVTCDETGLCQVDVLGPGNAAWDGKVFDATLWVPKSWLIRYAERSKKE